MPGSFAISISYRDQGANLTGDVGFSLPGRGRLMVSAVRLRQGVRSPFDVDDWLSTPPKK